MRKKSWAISRHHPCLYEGIGKGKVRPRTGHEGPEGE